MTPPTMPSSNSTPVPRGNGHSEAPLDIPLERLHAWIATQDPNAPYDQWIKVGMRLHDATDGAEEGLAVWEGWSAKATRQGPKGGVYVKGATRAHWLLPASGLNVYDIIRRDKLVLTKAALEALEARFK